MKALDRLRRPESLPWIFLAAAFLVLLALIGASVSNFYSVAQTHADVTLGVRSAATFTGLDASGNLSDNGTLTFTIFFDVNDPTSRGLTFFTVGYKVWLEDFPVELHMSGITRTPADIQVTNASGTFQFFPTFDKSVQTPPLPVPANGNATVPFAVNLTRAKDPGRFAAVQNITQYAVRVLGGTSALVWNVWVLVNLDIDGIPAPSSTSQATYFAAISRLQFIEGVDFGGLAVGGP